jgi:hypothetical protein
MVNTSIGIGITGVTFNQTLPTIDFPSPQQVALAFWILMAIAYILIMLYAIYGATKK